MTDYSEYLIMRHGEIVADVEKRESRFITDLPAFSIEPPIGENHDC